MGHSTSRRGFLKQSALAGAGFWAAGGISLADSKSANEKLNIACIGVGGKGDGDSRHAGQFGNIIAICDVNVPHLDKKSTQFPEAKKFVDFREMLDALGDKIDAVTVSTADHTHAAASVMAMKKKKHVYCQKPLTWSVQEARTMRQVAKEMGVATQMGNQGSASDGLRRGVEVLQAGAIGAVREVHVWTNRCGGYWKQAPDIVARPTDTPAIPDSVKWDLFLGPAPERPYHPMYQPFKWRGWRDFGTGALGDMACHTANLAFRALKLGLPTSVVAQSSEVNPETFQQWATIVYQFAARDTLPPVKLTWWEGKLADGKQNVPPEMLFHGEKITTSGSLFVGEKGTLYSPGDNGTSFVLLPKKDFEGYQAPKPTLPRLGAGNGDVLQKQEWVRACKGGPPAYSNFEFGSTLTETMILGNVAVVVGKEIQYDGAEGKITNLPDANKLLGRTYRKGWSL